MFRTLAILTAALSLVTQMAAAQAGRRWVWTRDSVLTSDEVDYELTKNAGGRAVALARYMDGQEHKVWMTSMYAADEEEVRAFCYSNMGDRAGEAVVRTDGEENAVVAIAGTRKVAAWVEDYQVWTASQALDTVDGPWPRPTPHITGDNECLSGHIALAAHGDDIVYIVYEEERYNHNDEYHLRFRKSADQGLYWDTQVSVVEYTYPYGEIHWPSLAVHQTDMNVVYVAYHVVNPARTQDTVVFQRSNNGGTNWFGRTEIATIPYAAGAGVCIAADRNRVVVFWSEMANGRYQVKYRTSTNSGSSFGAEQELPLEEPWIYWDKKHPNAVFVSNDEGRLYLMLTTQGRDATRQPVRHGVGMIHGWWDGDNLRWDLPYWLNETLRPGGDEMLPSMHGCDFVTGDVARGSSHLCCRTRGVG